MSKYIYDFEKIPVTVLTNVASLEVEPFLFPGIFYYYELVDDSKADIEGLVLKQVKSILDISINLTSSINHLPIRVDTIPDASLLKNSVIEDFNKLGVNCVSLDKTTNNCIIRGVKFINLHKQVDNIFQVKQISSLEDIVLFTGLEDSIEWEVTQSFHDLAVHYKAVFTKGDSK